MNHINWPQKKSLFFRQGWRIFLLFCVCYSSSFGFGQYPNTPEGQITGRLFSIQFDPMTRTLKVYGVGKPLGQIQFDGKKNWIEITAIRGAEKRKLEWNKSGDFIEVKEVPDWKDTFEVEISARISETRHKSETLKITVP